jgi:hemerythrin-like domain-containing protein
MKATTLLEHQHRNLEQLCDAVEHGSAGMRACLLPQLAGDLAAHIAMEEQVFYPAACEALHEDGWLQAFRARRAEAQESLHRAREVPIEGEEFARIIGELRGLMARHASEEENRLFPLLERAMDGSAMRELGQAMAALYDAKVEAGYLLD